MLEEFQAKWDALTKAGVSVARFFEGGKYRKVGICGGSETRCRLVEELRVNQIPNICFVDIGLNIEDYVDGVSSFPVMKLPELDLVIVTAIEKFESIKSELQRKTKAEIVSLDGIVSCMYDFPHTFECMASIAHAAGATLHFVRYTRLWELDFFTPYELALQNINERLSIDYLKTNPSHLRVVCGDLSEYSEQYVTNVYTCPPIVRKNGVALHSDYQSRFVNVVNGTRYTSDQPAEYENTVHILGQCIAYGFGIDDRHTIASYLQQMLNESPECTKFIVQNHGVWGADDRSEYLGRLQRLDLQPGDMVILIEPFYRTLLSNDAYDYFYRRCAAHGIGTYDTYHVLNGANKEAEVWLDCHHISHQGCRLLAAKLKTECIDCRQQWLPSTDLAKSFSIREQKTEEVSLEQHPDFKEYLSILQQQRRFNAGIAGAIVMNCNPFTLGHRYLIQAAAREVDTLYIFVVEEDKSFFPFKDRFMLVQLGTADLANVVVLPSGNFIISAITFKEYFSKDNPDTVAIDPSMDVELFAKHIAPAMGITVRFAGKEPFCVYTNQYNQAMKAILPRHGIRFVEMERIEVENEAISASKVRRLLKQGDFAGISRIVPPTTHQYLRKRFMQSNLHNDGVMTNVFGYSRCEHDILFEKREWNVPELPPIVFIEIAGYCNLKCPMCPMDARMHKDRQLMSFDLFKMIIDQISDVPRYLRFHVLGEPLLNPDIVAFLAYAKSKQHYVGFSTNAVMLNDSLSRELLSADLDWIQFSFDGVTKDIYEAIRINSYYEATLLNILNFQALNANKYNNKCVTRVASTLDPLPRYDQERAKAAAFWEGKISLLPVNRHDWGSRLSNGECRQPIHNNPCRHLWKSIAFSATGKMGYCCADGNFTANLPSCQDTPIADAWRTRFSDERKRQVHNIFESRPCSTCTLNSD